jgi:hypothetical protein
MMRAEPLLACDHRDFREKKSSSNLMKSILEKQQTLTTIGNKRIPQTPTKIFLNFATQHPSMK